MKLLETVFKVFRLGIACSLLLGVPASVLAQISAGGTPPSFSRALDTDVPSVILPEVDNLALFYEDETLPPDERDRFAVALDVNLNFLNSGVWEILPDGSRVWRLRIVSPGAYSLGLTYDDWYIPDGGRLFIYNDDRSLVIGAFTSSNNWKDGTNVTQPISGDAITLEYVEPGYARGVSRLSILKVAHAYRNLFGLERTFDDFGDGAACNLNVRCPEGNDWQDERRSVVLILKQSQTRLCSGALMNNTRHDLKPYVLTAEHCLNNNEENWIFVFNYESAGCANGTDPGLTQTIANDHVRAFSSDSDFALLELSSAVPDSYDPYFSGWDNRNVAASSSVCIHHPVGDIKKISTDTDPVELRHCVDPAHGADIFGWTVLEWNSGTTQPGSSGAPLFNQDHRVVGQLSIISRAGTTCNGNQSGTKSSCFGKFSESWTGDGTNDGRLKNWLDPCNTGLRTLDGLDQSPAEWTCSCYCEDSTYCVYPYVSIPDNETDTLYVPINVPVTWKIADLNLCLDISHTAVGHLMISVLSPTGTQVNLSLGNGGDSANYTCTTFDDEAAVGIDDYWDEASVPPYEGSFVPEDGDSLASFDDDSTNGIWKLCIYDSAAGESGKLNWFCLTFQTQSEAGADAGFDYGDLAACSYPSTDTNPANAVTELVWLGPCLTADSIPNAPGGDSCDDGVVFLNTPWIPCSPVSIQIYVNASDVHQNTPVFFNFWKDGNLDGDFCDTLCSGIAQEWALHNILVSAANSPYTFQFLDPGLEFGGPYDLIARARLTFEPLSGPQSLGGPCPEDCGWLPGIDSIGGEVEDYSLEDQQLPVELTSFEAIAGDGEVALHWSTASETDNDHFEILRDSQLIHNETASNLPSGDEYFWTDSDVLNGTSYSYTLASIAVDGSREELATASATPTASAAVITEYALHQNYPNPFNPATTISFEVPEAGHVLLTIHNLLGQTVATLTDRFVEAGRHSVDFRADALPSGIYLYRLQTDDFTAQRKALLVK